jgi:TetR/AcrR family transcriptional regulator, transcriptional repressor for nem operon
MNETATAIMDAAERRIREAGYSGFSFREIAADVGVKSASVHYHFPTKDALAAAVARRYTDRFSEAVDRQLSEGCNLIEACQRVFRRALSQDGRMCLCGALGATTRDLSPEVAAEVRRFFECGLQKLVDGGVTRDQAIRVLALLEGAMLVANALDDEAAFDLATTELF